MGHRAAEDRAGAWGLGTCSTRPRVLNRHNLCENFVRDGDYLPEFSNILSELGLMCEGR